MFRVRSVLTFAIHKYLTDRGFVNVTTPCITTSDCEGAGETFRITTIDPANVPLDADGNVVTSGGRVLGVTALGETHDEARMKAYRNVEKISFEGMQYRKEIGIVGKI